MESHLDEEEERRKRTISGSEMKWFRRYIAFDGVCDGNATWGEIQVGAEMEEEGVEWVLVSK